MHGGGAVVVVLGATVRIGEGGAEQMASHEMHAQHQEHQAGQEHSAGQEHQGQGAEDEACHCSCIGDGSAAVVAAILPTTLTLRVATIEAQPRHVVTVQTSETPTTSAERRLPFANGPPATRLA